MIKFSFENAATAKAFRISPGDTNYFVLLFDREKDDIDNIFVARSSPKAARRHRTSTPMPMSSSMCSRVCGNARCDGKTMPIKRGDALLLRPGSEHTIENTGPGKFYTLTVMTPNEGFAELIRGGQPVDLDEEDLKALGAAQWTGS